MLLHDQPHPGIRAIFATAPLSPGVVANLGNQADQIVPTGGVTQLYEEPRIELTLEPLIAAETALSLVSHILRGQVSSAKVSHRPEPGILATRLHRLEIRLSSCNDRDSVWRHLAGRGHRGMRWLVPPCGNDLNVYAVVQGPIEAEHWPAILGHAEDSGCSHLIVLAAEYPRRCLPSFRGICEFLVDKFDPDDRNPVPTWLESAAVAFIAEDKALECEALKLLFGSGPVATVLRAPRPGFLRRHDRSWQSADQIEFTAGDRCLISPGPYSGSGGLVVISPKSGRAVFLVRAGSRR